MIITLFSTMLLLLALMSGWILVQRAARRVAEQHPEAGPLRLIGGGCGGQGHGHEAESPRADLTACADTPAMAEASPAASAGGCAACANTACKPGVSMEAPTSCASAVPLHSLLAD
jgi:hypothetical protein